MTGTAFWRALAHCPADALHWASLAYRAGVLQGRVDILARLGEAGRECATVAGDISKQPTWDELVGHRTDSTPRYCSDRRCNVRCSRCIHAEAYERRGGRDFLGAQRETAPHWGAA